MPDMESLDRAVEEARRRITAVAPYGDLRAYLGAFEGAVFAKARAEVLAECFWCAEPKDDPVHSGKVAGVEREGSDGLGGIMDLAHEYLPLSKGAESVRSSEEKR